MPDLRVFRSNRIEILARLLGAVVRDHLPADPMQPIDVVVGSGGMARWLQHALAEQPEISICSNFAFPFPAARIDALVHRVLDGHGEPPRDAWSADTLTWALLDILPEIAARPGFDAIRSFLPDPAAWAAPADARRYGLAHQLAELFDRYVAFRPELATAWSRGQHVRLPDRSSSLAWQGELFSLVQKRLGDRRHRADRIAQTVAALESHPATDALEGPLYVFGVSSLPPSWMTLLSALARHADVSLFLLCPSPVYWAELHRAASLHGTGLDPRDRDALGHKLAEMNKDAAHPLLASMGKVARDFQLVLEAQPDHFVTDQLDAFPDPALAGRETALAWLQSDLLAARHPGQAAAEQGRALARGDDSVQFHACHGPTRQVEVLRNLLLGLLEDHPDLEARHIVVMTPDIETYAPLITAVFSQGPRHRLEQHGKTVPGADGWGAAGAPAIPFEIVDLSVRRINPVADALLRVLDLVDSRVPASSVVDLLTLEPVRLKFGFSPEDVTVVQQWISLSGIRWARDAAHRAQEGQPADPQNTWRFGLRRLLLGVVMADDGALIQGWDGNGVATQVRPFDDMEGGETVLLGRLTDFCNTLFELGDQLQGARPAAAWMHALLEVVDRMTATTKATSWLNVRVREELEEIAACVQAAGSAAKLGLDAMRSALQGRFEVPSRLTREQSGAVTFCAMRPMRSVPYPVVCLLGMDEGSFPRPSTGFAFDLTSRHPRVGDLDPRDEDRFLLLEAILAARRHLLVLYTGRDPRTNAETAPCVPVGELRDLLDQTAAAPTPDTTTSAWLTTEHPMQAFSPSAFQPPGPSSPDSARRRWSFDRRLLAGARARRNKQTEPRPFLVPVRPAPDAVRTELTLDELIRFYRHPGKYLLRTLLKVNLDDDVDAIPDREPIELDYLERWKLRRALIDSVRPDSEREERRLRAVGVLPLGFAGHTAVQQELELVTQMREKAGVSGEEQAPAPIQVDLMVDGVRLLGSVPSPHKGMLLEFQFSEEQADKLMAAWISMLAWHLSSDDAGRAVVLFGKLDKNRPKVDMIGFEPPEDPLTLLTSLVQIYQRGCREPTPLFPRASWRFAFSLRDTWHDAAILRQGFPSDEEQRRKLRAAHHDARKAWQSTGDMHDRAESNDAYFGRLFEATCPLDDDASLDGISLDFARLALEVYGPMTGARKTTREVSPWFRGGAR